jgi:uncharacterized protein (UPF0262 family)
MGLTRILIDPLSLPAPSPEVEHERKVAIFDLIEDNRFQPVGGPEGAYVLTLSVEDNRLGFAVEGEGFVRTFVLSQSSLRGLLRDYAMICDSYADALKNATPGQIESIDMGRRGIHNDGAALLIERFKDKIEMDKETARRLFTLVFALHLRS